MEYNAVEWPSPWLPEKFAVPFWSIWTNGIWNLMRVVAQWCHSILTFSGIFILLFFLLFFQTKSVKICVKKTQAINLINCFCGWIPWNFSSGMWNETHWFYFTLVCFIFASVGSPKGKRRADACVRLWLWIELRWRTFSLSTFRCLPLLVNVAWRKRNKAENR